MRQFYLKYQIFQSVAGKLTWTHYAELLGVSDDPTRGFYEKQAVGKSSAICPCVQLPPLCPIVEEIVSHQEIEEWKKLLEIKLAMI